MISDRRVPAATMTGPEGPEDTAGAYARLDEMPDELFYRTPRLVTHIDADACTALASYYAGILRNGDAVLDLMSSCVSHLPAGLQPGRVVGHGMNTTELAANPQLDEYFVRNLNRTPRLSFEDNTFDACLIAVSVQYLVDPVPVFSEIGRILKPEGIVAVSFSNRMFPTKAVTVWRETGDEMHGELVAGYLRRAGQFTDVQIRDISPRPGQSDPLFVVSALAA